MDLGSAAPHAEPNRLPFFLATPANKLENRRWFMGHMELLEDCRIHALGATCT